MTRQPLYQKTWAIYVCEKFWCLVYVKNVQNALEQKV